MERSSTQGAEPPAFAHFRVYQRPDGSAWTLGVGGMGMTYKAHDLRLRTDVALKVIHPARLGDRETQRLFLREARSAAKVRHPNVASVTFLEDSDAAFYAMEFIDGPSLHAWIRQHARAPLGQALAFAEQIAHGLSAIHERGLIHRDLKPANVMVQQHPPGSARHAALRASGGCQLKIIDFGLARATAGSAASGEDEPRPTTGFRGTAAYASPEQCEESADLDARSDLYALGCILWELLTGRPPFRGRNQRDLLNQHVHTEPPWPELGTAPAPLRELLAQLLGKVRTHRPADAAAAALRCAETRRSLGDAASLPLAPPVGAAPPPTPDAPTAAPAASPAPTGTATGTRITIELPSRRGLVAVGSLFALLAVASVWLLLRPAGATAPAAPPPTPDATQEIPTVAVLQFTGTAGDVESGQFARGVTEDLLSSLHRMRGLRIVSLSSSAVPEDQARLGLDGKPTAFLEGRVRRQGSRVRLTARLVDAAGSVQLWSETYERELLDVFEIQASIAQEIARALATNLTPDEQKSLARRPTHSAAAYELFLKGRTLWQSGSRTLAINEEVVALCEQATTLDPNFALAWAYQSRAHNVIYFYAYDRSPERLARSRRAVATALRLQPDLAEAHLASARVEWFEHPDPQVLLRAYQAALAVAPGNADILYALSDVHMMLLDPESALATAREAASRMPDDASKVGRVGDRLRALRRFGAAEEWYRRAMDAAKGNAVRIVRYELCRAERTGDWSRYVAIVKPQLARIPAEARWAEQVRIRDFNGALETIAGLPGTELASNLERVPKTLITSFLHRALGDEPRAVAEARAAVAAMKASTLRPLHPAIWQIKIAHAHARAGDKARALALGEAALKGAPITLGAIERWNVVEEFAGICAEIGERERAVELLRELLTLPTSTSPIVLRHSPLFDGLRGYAPFENLLTERAAVN